MMRNLIALLVLFSISKLAFTQVTISGVVLDSATQSALGESVIHLANRNVIADKNGGFSLSGIALGNHVLLVNHIGCKSLAKAIKVTKDTFIKIYLSHHIHAFKEVIAYGHEHNHEPDVRLVERISAKRLEKLAAVSLGEALQNVNGISFLRTGNSIAKPIINGMHSNRISVINDDSKQEGQQWGTEHAPEIDPLSAGSIEVIKGASTLRYGGDAMGGVIRILSAEFNDSSYTKISLLAKGEANPNGGQVGLKIENHDSNLGYGHRLVINGKRHGDASAANYVLSNTGYGQLSGSYFGQWTRDKMKLSATASAFVQRLGILSSAHIGNLTDLNRALESEVPLITQPFTFEINRPSQLIQHYSGKFKYEFISEQFGDITATYTLQHNHRQEFDNHGRGNTSALDLILETQQLNLLVDNHLNSFRWQYGVMGERQTNIYQDRYFIPNYLRYKGGAFAIATIEEQDYLLEAGVRYDFQNTNTYRVENKEVTNDEFNLQGASANISGWARINEDLRIHGSLATRFRSPDINELFSDGLHHGSAALEFGDMSLEQERSYSISSAINYNHNRLRIQIEPYFHYFNNYIYLQPGGETQLTIRGAFPVFNYVQTDATYTGTDIDLRYRLGSNWTLQSTTALVYAKDVRNNKYIFGIPAQQTGLKLSYLFAEFLGIQNGTWTIGSDYTARQNRVELGEDFTETPDQYILINTAFGGKYGNTPLSFNFGINNLLNTSYRDYMNRYRYFANDLGINIHLTINYNF